MTEVILTTNQYGKAENRVVRITRDTDRHEIVDLNVTSQLRGDFEAAHTEGDNSHVVATDTQKNTIFAFAKDGIASPEAFLLRLADHFTGEFDWVSGGRWAAEQYGWSRIDDHDHSFFRSSPGDPDRRARPRRRRRPRVISGFYGLTVLKTTQSGFVGYPKDRYTTLAETKDRILATDIATRWRYNSTDVDFNAVYESVKATLLDHLQPGLLQGAAAHALPDGRGGAQRAGQHRRDQVLLPEQAPLRLRPVASAGWTTRTRCSTPPTVRTA